jgi:ribosomal protein L24
MLVTKQIAKICDGDQVTVCGGKHNIKHGVLIKTTDKCHQVLMEDGQCRFLKKSNMEFRRRVMVADEIVDIAVDESALRKVMLGDECKLRKVILEEIREMRDRLDILAALMKSLSVSKK